MQYRVLDRQKLAYIDGGYVANYTIDDDYIVNNNTIVYIVKPTKALVGDIIVLIQTSGAYHKGVITAVDNSALTISYKSEKELFNDNILNPLRSEFDDGVTVAGKFGIEVVAAIIKTIWVSTSDPKKKLPIEIKVEGDVLDIDGKPRMLWTWDDNSIGFIDWLIELFEKYNVVLSWYIDYDAAQTDLSLRQPKIIVTLSCITNSGKMIKDNVYMQTITYTEESLPDATVSIVIDSESKEVLKTYYLAMDNEGEYYITENSNDINRMLPVKTIITEYDSSSEDITTTEEDAAEADLVPSQFSQSIEIQISEDSKMFDFTDTKFGDLYRIINENGTYNSIYTGRKQSSNSKWITLYFGLGRKNYTDKIQIAMRKKRYNVVYNRR